MYSPTGTVSWIIGNTDTISNICPKGYGIPSYSDFQSLLSVSGQAYSSNCYGGLYADGYFDRAEITISSSGSYNTYTVGSGVNVAYNGCVVYNPSTYASLFFPMAGQRSDTGVLSNAGSNANYWTSTLGTYSGSDRPYYLFGSLQSDSNKTDVYINLGDINSVGKSIRPIAVEVTDTGTTGTLDGFTDESGWE